MTGRLPFTHESFLDVFGAYNADLWPLAAGLWLLSAAAVGRLAAGKQASRAVAAVLALHWLASGALYHLGYFRAINAAAAWFGLAFLLQAALFLGFGVIRPRLALGRGAGGWRAPGLFFIAYAMAYPALALASGLQWPRLPLFAVPCPTTLLTAGCLLLAEPGRLRGLLVVPILWCALAGSAALALGVAPDLMLLPAGAALLLRLFEPSRPPPGAA